MHHVSVLEGIHDPKLRLFLLNIASKIHVKLGALFDVYIKDLYTNISSIYPDDITYNEIVVDFSIVPKPEVVFISKFAVDYINEIPLNSKVVSINPPSLGNPYRLTRYSLHRLMCPTFHDLNTNTSINNCRVETTVKLDSSSVAVTDFGGVIGIPPYSV